jgi:hypothetical protein
MPGPQGLLLNLSYMCIHRRNHAGNQSQCSLSCTPHHCADHTLPRQQLTSRPGTPMSLTRSTVDCRMSRPWLVISSASGRAKNLGGSRQSKKM